MTKAYISINFGKEGNEIEVSTYFDRLSRSEIDDISNVLWQFHWGVDAGYKLVSNSEGVSWVFSFRYSLSDNSLKLIKKELIELISNCTLSSKSIQCTGFDFAT